MIGAPLMGFPAPLVSCAVYWSICPRAVIVSNVELSTIVVGLFVTTTMAESRRTPATAWMTVLPTATDVSSAFEVTVAIVGSLLLQVAALAGNDCPRAFRICTGIVARVADRWERVVAIQNREGGRALVTPTTAVSEMLLKTAMTRQPPVLRAMMRPFCSTVTTVLSVVYQNALSPWITCPAPL